MKRAMPPRDLVGPETPLQLDVAAALAYPGGSMTASGLRKEASRGRLAVDEPRARITPHSPRSKK